MRKLNKTIATATMLITALFAAPTDVGAQMAWQENFDYPAGNLYGQGSWGKYASNPNEPIQVIDRALDYAGYPGGVKGKSVRLGPATNGEDLAARFDPSEEGIKSGTVYYSALINVEQPSTGPVYVMTLVARNFSSPVADGKSGTELGKLYVDAGNAEGEYRLGVERGGTNAAYAERTFSTGETYLVVVKYEIGVGGERQDAVSLFVNPASYTEEPALADAYFDPMGSGSGVGSWGLQGIELRQGTTYSATAPTMLVGSLRVADSYAGLFAEQQGPDEDAPAITLSERSLDFGGIYGGDVQTKTVNVKAANLKGDITVSVTGDELKRMFKIAVGNRFDVYRMAERGVFLAVAECDARGSIKDEGGTFTALRNRRRIDEVLEGLSDDSLYCAYFFNENGSSTPHGRAAAGGTSRGPARQGAARPKNSGAKAQARGMSGRHAETGKSGKRH